MRTPLFRSWVKLSLLTLAWAAWFAGISVLEVQAQTREECNSPQYRIAWTLDPERDDESGSKLEQACVAAHGQNYQQLPGSTPTAGPQNDGPGSDYVPPPRQDGTVSLEDAAAAEVQRQEAARRAAESNPVSLEDAAADQVRRQQEAAQRAGTLDPVTGRPPTTLDPVTGRPPVDAASRGANSRVTLQNPLSGINSIPDLLAAILQVFIIIAIPIIIFFIMLAGFKYVTARGNATQIGEASKALLYAIIGGVLILGATAIAQIIKNLVNAFR